MTDDIVPGISQQFSSIEPTLDLAKIATAQISATAAYGAFLVKLIGVTAHTSQMFLLLSMSIAALVLGMGAIFLHLRRCRNPKYHSGGSVWLRWEPCVVMMLAMLWVGMGSFAFFLPN